MWRLICLLLTFYYSACTLIPSGDIPANDYQRERQQLADDITFCKQRAAALRTEQSSLRLLYFRMRYAALSGEITDYQTAEKLLNAIQDSFGATPQLLLFKARFAVKLHRLPAAETIILQLDHESRRQAAAISADIALQLGRYQEAGRAYVRNAAVHGSWDNLARLAHYKFHSGAVEEAEALYVKAQQQLSAKQMREYAWLELQRGIIDLELQHYEQALLHYRHAQRAYSGYWLIEEHVAEVLALLGNRHEAIKLYKKIIRSTPKPELISALAQLYKDDGLPAADALFNRADRLFQQHFAIYPEASVGHYLEFLLLRQSQEQEILNFAQQNYHWRPNVDTAILLARVYEQLGEPEMVLQTMLPWRESVWRNELVREMIGTAITN